MRPGSEFRGRTANMTGRSIDRGVTWLDLHGRDHAMSQQIGNEMRVAGLHAFGIPGFFEYGPTITPAFYVTTTRLLGLPNDMQMRSVGVLRDIEPRILAMLGVRFVITDAPFDGAARLRAPAGERRNLVPLRDRPPRVGRARTRRRSCASRSQRPTSSRSVGKRGLRSVARNHRRCTGQCRRAGACAQFAPHFRWRVAAAGSSKVRPVGPALTFGVSSRRLKVTSIRSGEPILFRANLLETGILFSGRLDVTVSIRTGVFLDLGAGFRKSIRPRHRSADRGGASEIERERSASGRADGP